MVTVVPPEITISRSQARERASIPSVRAVGVPLAFSAPLSTSRFLFTIRDAGAPLRGQGAQVSFRYLAEKKNY